MAYSWQATQTNIIDSALRKLAVLQEGDTASTSQLANAQVALNSIIKGLEVKGMPVWAMQTYTLSYDVSGNLSFVTITPNDRPPLKIVQMTRTTGGVRVPMEILTKYDYNLRPNTKGTPVAFYNDIANDQFSYKYWPRMEKSETFEMVGQRPFADLGAQSQALDFPAFWTDALIYHLAWRLAPEFAIPLSDRKALQAEALYFENEALSYGTEEGSLFLQPTRKGW